MSIYCKQLAAAGMILLATVTTSMTAMAQDGDWDGLYIGGLAGYHSGKISGIGQLVGVDETDTLSGITYGVLGGYGVQNDRWVFGFEADVSSANVNGDITVLGIDVTEDLNWAGNLRGRAGYLIEPDWLVYGAAGVAIADYEINTNSLVSGNDSAGFTGWTIGAGTEKIFTDKVNGRLEYLYSNYGSENMFENVSGVDMDTKGHTVRAGIIFKF